MNRFRKWLFKFLTGYELIDYGELLKTATKILDLAGRINEEQKETMQIARATNERYKKILEQYEGKTNEALD